MEIRKTLVDSQVSGITQVDKLPQEYWIDLIGTPFKVNGRGPDYYDCYGLIIEIYKRMGLYAPDYVYGESAFAHRTMIVEKMETDWEKVTDFTPGNVLVLKEKNSPQHVGLIIDQDRFIHASGDREQVCIERLSSIPQSSLLAIVKLKEKA